MTYLDSSIDLYSSLYEIYFNNSKMCYYTDNIQEISFQENRNGNYLSKNPNQLINYYSLEKHLHIRYNDDYLFNCLNKEIFGFNYEPNKFPSKFYIIILKYDKCGNFLSQFQLHNSYITNINRNKIEISFIEINIDDTRTLPSHLNTDLFFNEKKVYLRDKKIDSIINIDNNEGKRI